MISVIIPFYNSEAYLSRCIDSVLHSTYQNFELLLINDGSDDNSAGVCKEYEKSDLRIHYYEQQNQGVSAARNKGIEECRGEWIVFVDSDDFIAKDFLETISLTRFQNQDLLIFDDRRSGKVHKSRRCKKAGHNLPEVFYSQKDTVSVIEKMLYSQQLIQNGSVNLRSPWAKAYRKSLIDQHGIRFSSDLFIGEDKIFNIEYQLKIKAFAYIPKTVYYVEWRPESATHCFQQELIRNNHIFQNTLKNIFVQNEVWSCLEKAYYENVLATMTEVLVNGIFDPRNKNSSLQKRKLCEEVHMEAFFLEAMEYNRTTGNIPRKVLLFFFYLKYYGMVSIICKMSYFLLRIMKR